MGRHGCGTINNNGERLVEFCLSNRCIIGGTIFPHRDIHKLSWRSPDGNTVNQIDHVIANKKWQSRIFCVGVIVKKHNQFPFSRRLVVFLPKLTIGLNQLINFPVLHAYFCVPPYCIYAQRLLCKTVFLYVNSTDLDLFFFVVVQVLLSPHSLVEEALTAKKI